MCKMKDQAMARTGELPADQMKIPAYDATAVMSLTRLMVDLGRMIEPGEDKPVIAQFTMALEAIRALSVVDSSVPADLLRVAHGEIGALTAECERLAGSVDRNAVEVLRDILADGFLSDSNTARGHIALKSAAPAKPEPAVPSGWIYGDSFYEVGNPCLNDYIRTHGRPMFAAAPVAQPLAPSGAAPVATDYKLQDGEVIFYSRLGRSDDGLPFMTDSDQHGVWDVAMVFQSTHKRPSRVFVEPYYAAQPLAGQDVRAVTDDLREFVEAVAGPAFTYIDRETDENCCSGCHRREFSTSWELPGEIPHTKDCIVLRARAHLAAASPVKQQEQPAASPTEAK